APRPTIRTMRTFPERKSLSISSMEVYLGSYSGTGVRCGSALVRGAWLAMTHLVTISRVAPA
ncbi:hypothetical protein V1979_34340, partial [Pseudomonas aeruginosa]